MSSEKKIYYLGPQTSYTDVAKEKLKSQFNLTGYKDIERRTITAAASELSDLENKNSLVVLPIENSIEGIVKEAIDSISRIEDKDVKILGECVIPISHCLITYAKDLSQVKTIISHPQAISQCFDYLYRTFGNGIVYKSETSTANAVKNITPDDCTIAAIGSRYSAGFYHKPIVEENINDEKFNQTRFILAGKMAMPKFGGEYKTSITFSTENKSGALCKILKILENYNINMSYISSRPSKKVLGEYSFYIDFDGKITDERVAKATFEILQHVKTFKHLGTYPKAQG
ncbi:MAG: prephenate dehydratase [Candidatus Gastranaerophilales bacterium]|nr:prephenate dehydratase [Candidatus Gastranaerophilales bacterium]